MGEEVVVSRVGERGWRAGGGGAVCVEVWAVGMRGGCRWDRPFHSLAVDLGGGTRTMSTFGTNCDRGTRTMSTF